MVFFIEFNIFAIAEKKISYLIFNISILGDRFIENVFGYLYLWLMES